MTIKEIAALANTSRATVDRVLNNRGKVKKEVKDKILAIIKEANFVHKTKKKPYTFTIGIILYLTNASFMVDIKQGIMDAIKEKSNHKTKFLIYSSEEVDEEKQLAFILKAKNEVDGLIIMAINTLKIRNALNDLKIPIVTLNSDIESINKVAFVGIDNKQSGQIAASLISDKVKVEDKILIITGFLTNMANSLRAEGFMQSLVNHNIILTCSYDNALNVQQIIDKHKDDAKLKAIYICSAGQAGIYEALKKTSIKPLVIAHDFTLNNRKRMARGDFDYLIDQNGYQQGYNAVEVIYQYLKTKKIAENKCLIDILVINK